MKKASEKQSRLKTFMQYMVSILVALIVSYLVIETFHPVVVSGDSMNPTLKNGDIMISTKTFTENSLQVGDIVVFKYNGIQLIKRIVAKSGDEIWIHKGNLYVNAQLSPYQYEPIEDAGILKKHYVVPEGEYFCIGDNRNASQDSREIGSVHFTQIRSKILRHVLSKKEL